MKKTTGRVSVYLSFSEGFFGKLRPAYDTAADAVGELTQKEVNTLRGIIHRYVDKCHKRHGNMNLIDYISKD